MAVSEQPWHRRHAIHIAGELPDQPEDALIVLRLATEFVTDFLAQPEPAQRPAPTVVLIGRDI